MNLTTMTVVFCGLLAVLLGIEIAARTTGRIEPLPALLDQLLRHRGGQVCVLLAWWWLGWHFLAD